MMLFGQFVGSWDIDGTWYQQGGESRQGKGEWHFAWILGGCGIQDVLFTSGAAPHQFGTTIRCYDKAMDAWHIVWMQPASGEFVRLLGRKIADRILIEGVGTDLRRRERWSFNKITPASFLWLGEVSFDGGVTWILEQDMRARRLTTAGVPHSPAVGIS
jgi:hypothetical protein